MEIKKRKVCRLCLKTCDTNFEAIDGITRESFAKHLPKLDLTISTHPVMCRKCAEKFNEYCHFKSRCLDTQHYIISFVNTNAIAKVNITEIYYVKKRRENIIDITGDHKVCRFCMELEKNASCIVLNNEEKDALVINIMLQTCLKELDLSITEQPVICLTCYESLQSNFEFLTYCFDTEKKIQGYCETKRIDGKGEVKLCDVLKFAPRNMLGCEDESNRLELNKLRAICFEKEGSTESDPHKSNENSKEMKKKKMQIEKKKRKKKIKTEGSANFVFYIKSQNIAETKEITLIDKKERVEVRTEIEIDQGNPNSSNLTPPVKVDLQTSLTREDPSKSKVYKCEECLFETKYDWYFEQHLTSHKDNPNTPGWYNCAMCTYRSRRKSDYERHLVTHERLLLKCAVCPFETKFKSRLRSHNETHRNPSDLRCKLCPFVAKRPLTLRQHMKAHREKPTYKCERCIYETSSTRYFKQHVLTHKTRLERRNYKCAMCHYETTCRRSIINHLPVHKSQQRTSTVVQA